LPTNAVNTAAGTYRPTSSRPAPVFPSPAPAGPASLPAPQGTATFASVFNGIDPNGTWNLYIHDFASGDVGSMTGGWTLNITTTGTTPAQSVGALKATVLASGAAGTLPMQLAAYLKSAESYLAIGSPTMKAAACQQLKLFKSAVAVAMRIDSVVLAQGPTWISQADAIRAAVPCVAPN
jgi:hypothetical protein